MRALLNCWTDRTLNIEPLEVQQAEMREEIADHFARLSVKAKSDVNYSQLLESGKTSSHYIHCE